MKLPGRKKSILFILLLFGPGFLLIMLSRGQQKFSELETLNTLEFYSFFDIDSNIVSSETNDKKVIIFTTIQNSCFDNENIQCSIYPYFIDEFFYREYIKSPDKYKGVQIYSIVTDKDGNSVAPSDLLKEEFARKYDPKFWQLLIGDPKQVYSFKNKEGVIFSDLRDEKNQLRFLKMGLLANDKNEIKAIRPLTKEGFVREFNEKFRMLMKIETVKKYNETR